LGGYIWGDTFGGDYPALINVVVLACVIIIQVKMEFFFLVWELFLSRPLLSLAEGVTIHTHIWIYVHTCVAKTTWMPMCSTCSVIETNL